MRGLEATVTTLLVLLAGAPRAAAAAAGVAPADTPPRTAVSPPFLLGPPRQVGPVVVRAGFALRDINEIDDVVETFEFSGVLTLIWNDPRQAFDPALAGVNEKVFQGSYQFNELATGWYPQVVLRNESGLFQKSGVVLRVQPDGTSTLIETITAAAESDFDMKWFPFDSQRLEIVFEVLGFDRNEIVLESASTAAGEVLANTARIPQWTITGAGTSVREGSLSYAGGGIASAFVVRVDVERQSFYIRRLVSFPLIVIVLLSFSVFWMDRASLGDRISVSFIGLLTGVTYQLVMGSVLPRISYVTLMHGFLTLSFLTMCATVVINLVVGALDQQGRSALGDRIDRRCRWMFPLGYFGLIFVMMGLAKVFF